MSTADLPEQGGRVIAVWGPAGAPGRTTIALGLGAELARRGAPTLVVDADPWGGAVAQHLGIMDEPSGLLAAARLSGSGELDERYPTVLRQVSENLGVLTGLPRPDRYVEVRPGSVEHVAELGRTRGHVVVDTGFCLEDDPAADFGTLPGRNSMTLGALSVADEVVVVGSADPVGLSRLVRGLVELRERVAAGSVRVVINRMRSSLGWSEKEIAGMVDGFTRLRSIHFVSEDRAGADKALAGGRTLVEAGDSTLARGISGIVDVLSPDLDGQAPRGRFRRRRGGRSR